MKKKAILKELMREIAINKKKKKKERGQLLNDPNFEPLRSDKTKIPKGSQRDQEIASFYIAINMIRCFKYSSWMSNSDVIGPNNERIDSRGEIYMPGKFMRKTNNQSSFVIEREVIG